METNTDTELWDSFAGVIWDEIDNLDLPDDEAKEKLEEALFCHSCWVAFGSLRKLFAIAEDAAHEGNDAEAKVAAEWIRGKLVEMDELF